MAKTYQPIDQTESRIIKAILYVILIVIVAILLFNSLYTINSGERGVLLTFGKASNIAITEGIHTKIPFVQKVIKMNIRTQKYEADATAASKDLQIVSAKIATNFHISPEKAPEIFINMGLGYSDSVIQPMEQEIVKSITALFTAEELVTKREEVRQMIKETFKERLEERDIMVEEVSIVNFDFSTSFNDAIENKVTMEQNALAAKNKLEQVKFEALQVAAQAEGQKQAKIALAQGDAQAIDIINQQLKNSPTYIEYYKIQRWNGVLSMVVGNSMPIISLNNSLGGN